ncbi:MAG TPA: hypothetical protein VMT99_03005 [Candidatus Paceibacterota bacterium]|nr:hypothetical protein [Candidatus Paceibacterota bacterium]
MSIIEDRQKIRQEAERAKRQTEQRGETVEQAPVFDPTLQEILSNPEESQLFGSYLEHEKKGDLGARLAKNELKPEDLEALESDRVQFVKRLEAAKRMEGHFAESAIQKLVDASPRFRKIANVVGVKNVSEAFTKHLVELSVAEPHEFMQIERAITRLIERQKREERLQKEIVEICRKYKIPSVREYLKAVDSDDPEALKKLVAKSMGRLERFVKGRSGELEEEVKAANKRAKLDSLEAWAKDDLEEVGRLLSISLTNNDRLRSTLVSFSKKEDVLAKSPVATFRDVRIAEEAWESLSEEEVGEAWETYKKERPAMTDVKKEKEGFWKVFARRSGFGAKSGFWSDVATMTGAASLAGRFESKLN